MTPLCACGCGNPISRTAVQRHRRFLRGHNERGKRHPWATRPNTTNVNTGHDRARRVIPVLHACELAAIGGCHGPLQRAHLDQNPVNNDPANIKVLCISHHFLYDRGWIDLANPIMPPFMVSHGKRRYKVRKAWRAAAPTSSRLRTRAG